MSACDCRVHVSAWLRVTLWALAYLGLLVLVFAGGYGLRALTRLVRQPSAREFGLMESLQVVEIGSVALQAGGGSVTRLGPPGAPPRAAAAPCGARSR
jgi:hypothetical protein